ncbi:MAG: hypothetical protein IKJ19_02745 [Clostridia bacterium]|nr:hypothetical protein [Clostridia bacterium]
MKKLFALLFTTIMLLTCVFAMNGCSLFANKPEFDLELAKENLEDRDYYVSYHVIDDYYSYDNKGMKESLYAYNEETDGTIEIVVFENEKIAKLFLEVIKLEFEQEKEYCELEIKFLEEYLKVYKNKLSSSEIDEIEDEIKELKLEIEEEFGQYIFGRRGKIVWFGNEKGINATKSK